MASFKIASGQGFYGDSIRPAVDIARKGDVDYIAFDCLAELTLAILQKNRQRDPGLGYTRDIKPTMQQLLPLAKENNIRLVTNAGGINPHGAAEVVAQVAEDLGIDDLKIGLVTGDDIYDRLEELQNQGVELRDYHTGDSIGAIQDDLLFANVYLGFWPIAEALDRGADVVITGRTTDTAQFLGPVLHEFDWDKDDWDRLAQGILLGHIMECSAQASGGNFSGDWWNVPDLHNVGFPISEVREDGSFVISKLDRAGGEISFDTIKEQMLYEIHDPANYITPDVVADFTSATLEEVGSNQVLASGATGKPAPDTLKAVAGYSHSYTAEGLITYAWPDALEKAKTADEIFRQRLENLDLEIADIRTELIGMNSIHGERAPEPDEEPNEVGLRIAVRTPSRSDAGEVARLFAPFILAGVPHGVNRGGGDRSENIGLWTALIDRDIIESETQVDIREV